MEPATRSAPAGNETQMAREIAEIPAVVARQIAEGMPIYREEGERLRALQPRFFVTCARGTSDHAATYFKYLVETRLGVPVASIGPSVASIYRAPLRTADAVCITISQSGASPDLIALQERAGAGGARKVALLNVTGSLVAQGADTVLPMLAGPERAVAATKSYVASLVALAALYGAFAGDNELLDAIERLPGAIEAASGCDWTGAGPIVNGGSLFTVSRGPGLSIANEAALKFKETCRLHAEAYSAAEVRHGPIALARDRFSALVFLSGDESRTSVLEAATAMRAGGAKVFLVDSDMREGISLKTPKTPKAPHALLVPVIQAVAFYRYVDRLAGQLGENPDAPPNLQKVTQTT